MKNMTIRNIAAACGGSYHGPKELLDKEITAVTTDSSVAPATASRNSANAANTPATFAQKKSERGTGRASAAAAVPLSSSRPIAWTAADVANTSPNTSSAEKPHSRGSRAGSPNWCKWPASTRAKFILRLRLRE